MALPMNDNFANCELSLEELEAIAAGGFWSTVGHIGISAVKYAAMAVPFFVFGMLFGADQAAKAAGNPNPRPGLSVM
jgi:hypothetical protein